MYAFDKNITKAIKMMTQWMGTFASGGKTIVQLSCVYMHMIIYISLSIYIYILY